MSDDPWSNQSEALVHRAGDTVVAEHGGPNSLPPGPWISVALLWLCFGLPVSALAFLGLPALLGLLGIGLLDSANVPLEQWSPTRPWMLLAFAAIVVNRRASFIHRRDEQRPGSNRLWIGVGVVAGLAWIALLGLEEVPRTELNPKLHYWALSIVVGWTSLAVAWVSGRGVSLVLRPLERRAMRSSTARGAVTAAGPMSALGMLVVGSVVVGLDLAEEQVEDVQAAVQSSVVERKVPHGGDGDDGQRSSRAATMPRSWRFADCITALYEGPSSPFERAVKSIESMGVDAEDVAAETAVVICEKQPTLRDLRGYYFRSVQNRARTSRYRARRRLDECPFQSREFGIPTGETPGDCAFEQLCNLESGQQRVIRLHLEGYTDLELGRELGISHAAATKRRQRAMQSLSDRVVRECEP